MKAVRISMEEDTNSTTQPYTWTSRKSHWTVQHGYLFNLSTTGKTALELILQSRHKFKGQPGKQARAATTHTTLSKTTFYGRSSRYTFDQHLSKIQRAYNQMQHLKQEVPEVKKVADLSNSIKVSQLQTTKDHILGDLAKIAVFEAVQQ